MALLTKGYFSTKYFPSSYWMDDYWTEYAAIYIESITDGVDLGDSISANVLYQVTLIDGIDFSDSPSHVFTAQAASLLTDGYFIPEHFVKGYWNDRYWQNYAYPGYLVYVNDKATFGDAPSSVARLLCVANDGISAGDIKQSVQGLKRIITDGANLGDIIASITGLFSESIADIIKLSDAGDTGTELIVNGGFETAGTGGSDVFGTWVETLGTGNIEDETTDYYKGSHACKITYQTGGGTYIRQAISPDADSGDRYRLRFYTRGDGTNAGRYRVLNFTHNEDLVSTTSTGITGTTYTEVVQEFLVHKDCTIWVYFYPPAVDSGYAYFDQVSLKKLQSPNIDLTLIPSVSDKGLFGESESSSLTVQLSNGNDDGEYRAQPDTYHSSLDTVRMGDYSGDSADGCFRFRDVQIPKGSTIDSAYIDFWVYSTTGETLDLTCYGVKESNTEDFSSNPFSRTATTASVDFSWGQWPNGFEANDWKQSPDITSLVQEIVDQRGWEPGNSMGFFVLDDGTNALNDNIQVRSYEGNSARAAKLVVNYTAPQVSASVHEFVTALDGIDFGDTSTGNFIRAILLFRQMGLLGSHKRRRFFFLGQPGATWNTTVTDGADFGEATSSVFDHLLTVLDGVNLGDVISALTHGYKTITDGADFGETVNKYWNVFEQVTDGADFSETVLGYLTVDGSLSDGIFLGDIISALMKATLTVTDGTTFGELVSHILTGAAAVAVTVTDGIDFGDSAEVYNHFVKTVSDKFKVSDEYWSTEQLSNIGFETAGAGGADVFANWTEEAGTGSIDDEGSIVNSGSHACKLTAPAVGTTQLYQSINAYEGEKYKLEFYTRGDGANAGRYRILNFDDVHDIQDLTSTGVPGTTYTKVTKYFTVNRNCELRIYFYAPSASGGIAYFDDASLTKTQSPVFNYAVLPRILTDGLEAGDTPNMAMIVEKVLADGVDFVDVISAALKMAKTILDGSDFGDAVDYIAAQWLSLTATDGADLGENLSAALRALTTTTDKISIGDAISVLASALTNVSDGFKFGDVVGTLIKATLDAADGADFADAVSRYWSKTFTATDGIDAGDSASEIFQVLASIEDKITFSDVVTVLTHGLKAIADGANFADTIGIIATAIYREAIADGMNVGDSILNYLHLAFTSIDGFDIGEVTSTDATFNVTVSDKAKMGDVVSTLVKFGVAITDGGKLGDITTYTWISSSGYQAKIAFIVKGRTLNFTVKGRELDFVVKSN